MAEIDDSSEPGLERYKIVLQVDRNTRSCVNILVKNLHSKEIISFYDSELDFIEDVFEFQICAAPSATSAASAATDKTVWSLSPDHIKTVPIVLFYNHSPYLELNLGARPVKAV